jgi:transcriptional regulator with XRE-family HTH domain
MLTKEIGKQIKQRRINLKMDQETLEDYSGLKTPVISNIENGLGNPTLKTLEKLLEPLGLEIKLEVKNAAR